MAESNILVYRHSIPRRKPLWYMTAWFSSKGELPRKNTRIQLADVLINWINPTSLTSGKTAEKSESTRTYVVAILMNYPWNPNFTPVTFFLRSDARKRSAPCHWAFMSWIAIEAMCPRLLEIVWHRRRINAGNQSRRTDEIKTHSPYRWTQIL